MLEICLTIISPFVSLVLLFWFKTDFVLEYGRVLGLRKLLAIDRYENSLQYNPKLTYQLFIATNYNKFFHKLINCPVCLATWVSILSTGLVAFISGEYLIVLTIPLSINVGTIIYLLIKKLI